VYYDFLQRHKRRIITVSSLLLVAFVILVTVELTGRIGKLAVTISAVPRNATVIVNDRQVSSGTHWLTPGNYSVKASREGFEDIKKSIEVTGEKTENVVALSLTPKSEEAKKWADKHQSEYSRNEQYGAVAAAADGKYFADKNPITKKLPFKNPYYTIGYKTQGDAPVTLTIVTPSPRYRFYAIEKIREWGFDPTHFRIEFQGFKNPLEEV